MVGPVRGTLGYVVGRVDAVGQVAGKSLEAARPEIVAKLTTQKSNAAIQKLRDAIEDSLADNANINEVASEQKLTVHERVVGTRIVDAAPKTIVSGTVDSCAAEACRNSEPYRTPVSGQTVSAGGFDVPQGRRRSMSIVSRQLPAQGP